MKSRETEETASNLLDKVMLMDGRIRSEEQKGKSYLDYQGEEVLKSHDQLHLEKSWYIK